MLKVSIDKLEDVDEGLRPLYVEKDGKFTLEVEGLEDTAALRRNLQQARSQETKIKQKLDAWEKVGKTPEEIAQLLADIERQNNDELHKQGDVEKIKAAMQEKHEKEVARLQKLVEQSNETVGTLKHALQRGTLEQAVMEAIGAERGRAKVLRPVVLELVKTVEDNGATKVVVVDEKGEPRLNGKGDPMTVRELVAEMRSSDDYGSAFEGNNASGSGAHAGHGGGGLDPKFAGIKSRADFGPPGSIAANQLRGAFIEKYGLQRYEALPLTSPKPAA